MTSLFTALCPKPTLFKATSFEVRTAALNETVVFRIKQLAV